MSRQVDLLFGLKDLIGRFADVHGVIGGSSARRAGGVS